VNLSGVGKGCWREGIEKPGAQNAVVMFQILGGLSDCAVCVGGLWLNSIGQSTPKLPRPALLARTLANQA